MEVRLSGADDASLHLSCRSTNGTRDYRLTQACKPSGMSANESRQLTCLLDFLNNGRWNRYQPRNVIPFLAWLSGVSHSAHVAAPGMLVIEFTTADWLSSLARSIQGKFPTIPHLVEDAESGETLFHGMFRDEAMFHAWAHANTKKCGVYASQGEISISDSPHLGEKAITLSLQRATRGRNAKPIPLCIVRQCPTAPP